jgi:hypothetical protein
MNPNFVQTQNSNETDIPNQPATQTILSVAGTAVAVSINTNKTSIEFLNYGTTDIYAGPTSAVTVSGATRGRKILPGLAWAAAGGPKQVWYLIRDGAAEDVLITQS